MKRSLAFVPGGLLLSATATEAADPDYLLPDLSAKALVHDGERLWARGL